MNRDDILGTVNSLLIDLSEEDFKGAPEVSAALRKAWVEIFDATAPDAEEN